MNPAGGWKRGTPLWTLGNTTFSLYPIMIFLGILSSFLTICYFWKRQKYPWEILQVMLIIAIPSAIFGARLWYAFFNPSAWSQFFVFSGMAIQGAVIFSTLAVLPYAYSKRHVIDIRIAVGIIIPSILIGQTIGRLGNFFNHEVYGMEVSGPSLNWLDWIGIKSNMLIDGKYRAPFFLYEMFGTFSAYIIIVWILLYRNLVRPGVSAGLYLIAYGIIRLIMEPLRDPVDIMMIGNLQISTIMSLLILFLGIFFTILWQFFSPPFYPFIKKIFSNKFLNHFQKEYELITPIKPRRKFILFGKWRDTRFKYTFFGQQVDNHVRLWIPVETAVKWSKREINAGHKSQKKSSNKSNNKSYKHQ